MTGTRILAQKAVREWLEGVRYPNDGRPTNSMGLVIWRSLREDAAAFYAKRYHAEHGRLPEGTHRVVVSVGPRGGRYRNDIEHPCGGVQAGSNSRLEIDITYPADPPR
jgi:hypothetical protein